MLGLCSLPVFYLGPNYGGDNEDYGDLLQKVPCTRSVPPTLQQATIDLHLCWRLLDTHGQVWVSPLWGHCSLLLGSGAHKVVCALQESVSPVLCKFWQLSGGVNGNLLQEGLCHTQVCCTQSPLSLWLTQTSTGDSKTLKGRSDSVSVGSPGVHNILFEPSKHLWWEWGLILNANLPLLPSCWGLSFAIGLGISSHSCSSTMQPLLHCLPSC